MMMGGMSTHEGRRGHAEREYRIEENARKELIDAFIKAYNEIHSEDNRLTEILIKVADLTLNRKD